MIKSSSNKTLKKISLYALVALASLHVQAQLPVPPASQFDVSGHIQAATLDSSCTADPLCGGTITVNNQQITVPKSTVLQMPAKSVSWQQLFAQSPGGIPLPPAVPQTGLAKADGIGSTYEAHIVGNRVGDTYIAGLIFIAQSSLEGSQGFINYIDYTTGTLEVGGTIGVQNSGQKVLLNDPAGTFGRASGFDARFTIDESNPTVRSETAYPMCIPRVTLDPKLPNNPDDPLCPQSNRPPGTMIFTMSDPRLPINPGATDPNLMAPFEIGDFVTYSGYLSGNTVIAHSVVANVGIYTVAGTSPAYVAIDVAILGTGGSSVTGAAEATIRTRFEGFTTDISRNILLFGVDKDACTGTENGRLWGSIGVDQGAPAGVKPGRWRFRPPCTAANPSSKACSLLGNSTGVFDPATREVRAAIESSFGSNTPAKTVVTKNGLTANLYQAPIFDFIFPENGATGTAIVANNFESMPFLAQGSGPLSGSSSLVGQLSPWPGAVAPAPVVCVPLKVLGASASASPNPSASGASITLTGILTNASPAATVVWSQTGGTPVVLSSTTSINPTFTAPIVPPGPAASLTFKLTATDGAQTASGNVTVTVNPTASDAVTGLTAQYRTTKQRLTVSAGSSASPVAQLTMQAYKSGVPQGGPQPLPFVGGNLYTIILVGVAQPDTVKVTSDHGGSATTTVSIRQ